MNCKNSFRMSFGLLSILFFNQVIKADNSSDSLKYQVFKNVLSKYTRAFTMLDVGTKDGMITLKSAADFPQSVFVMIENGDEENDAGYGHNSALEKLCSNHDELSNIVLLYKHLISEDLKHLGTCEHFDIVLGSHIGQYGIAWQKYVQALLTLGDNVFIEISNVANNRAYQAEAEAYLKKMGGKVVYESNDNLINKIIYFTKSKTSITRKYWVAEENTRRQLKVISNFDHKFMVKSHKNYTRISSWIPGINLLTFKMLNGIYPRKRGIKRLMNGFSEAGHPDPFLWNIVIQGKKLELIDWDPLAEFKFDPKKCLKFNILALSLRDPLEIRKFVLDFNKEREKYIRYPHNFSSSFLDEILHTMNERISLSNENLENQE